MAAVNEPAFGPELTSRGICYEVATDIARTCCVKLPGQRTRKGHENDQSNDRDNDDHNNHFRVLETLARDHKCSRDVTLTGAKCHDAPGVSVRSAK